MISSIIYWLRLIKLPVKNIIAYLILTLLELLCYTFGPVSFATIASYVTEQNIQLAKLWASINMMLQILGLIIIVIKQQLLTNLSVEAHSNLSTKPNLKIEDIKYFSNFIFKFNSLIIFFLKLLIILISSIFFSLYLTLFILLAYLFCFIIGTISNKIRTNKESKDKYGYQVLICDSILNAVWHLFSFIILYSALNLIQEQNITLSIFLLVSTFISNQISKPFFSIKYLINLNLLSKRILYIKNSNFVE